MAQHRVPGGLERLRLRWRDRTQHDPQRRILHRQGERRGGRQAGGDGPGHGDLRRAPVPLPLRGAPAPLAAMSGLRSTFVTALACCAVAWPSGRSAAAEDPSAPVYEMALQEAWIPMQDGVRL